MTAREQKKEYRARLSERASALEPAARAAESAAISDTVLRSFAFRQARTVFCFVSLPSEPDTRPILEETLRSGKTLLVPKCVGKTMVPVPVTDLSALKPGAYGIPEPVSLPSAPCPEPDLVLVPCVAASKTGARLGHGAGYYDAYLAACPAPKVCLCFDALLLPDLPAEPHDVPMDAVVTASGVFACANGGIALTRS